MDRSDKKRLLGRWKIDSEYMALMGDSEVDELFDFTQKVNAEMEKLTKYEDKIDKRHERWTVSYGGENPIRDGRFFDGVQLNSNKMILPLRNNVETKKTARSYKKSYSQHNKPGDGSYKFSPEELYVKKKRMELMGDVLESIFALLTKTQIKTLNTMLKIEPAHCKESCKMYGKCGQSYPNEYMKIDACRRGYKHKEYISDTNVAKELGKTKSAVSKLMSRLRAEIKEKYAIHPEDYSFIMST